MKNKLRLLALATATLSFATFNLKAEGKFVDNFKSIEKEPAKLEQFISDFNLAVPYEGKYALYKFQYEPKVMNDKSCLSLYDIAISLGKSIYWDPQNRLVIIDADEEVVLPIDKKVVYVDGKIYKIDIPATIDAETGRTYLPLRTLGDVLGYDVKWNNKNKTAIFSLKEKASKLNYSVLKEVDEDSFEEYFKLVKDSAVEEKNINDDNNEEHNHDDSHDEVSNAEHAHNDGSTGHDHEIENVEEKEIVLTSEDISKAEKATGTKFYAEMDDIKKALKDAILNKKEAFKFLSPNNIGIERTVVELNEVIKQNKGIYQHFNVKMLDSFLLFTFVE